MNLYSCSKLFFLYELSFQDVILLQERLQADEVIQALEDQHQRDHINQKDEL